MGGNVLRFEERVLESKIFQKRMWWKMMEMNCPTRRRSQAWSLRGTLAAIFEWSYSSRSNRSNSFEL